jgi:hypothetical protein
MNRKIDVLEWLSFNQKRLWLSTPGITFSLWTGLSLLQSTRGASSTSSPRTDIWLSFNTIFMSMNRKIDGLEWLPFNQKRLWLSTPGITFSLWTRLSLLAAIDRGASSTSSPRIDDSLIFKHYS